MLTMEPERKTLALSRILIFLLSISLCGVKASSEGHHGDPQEGPVVKKDQRTTLLATEFGQITALDIKEEPDKLPYHLQFITLEPNSLFLPVLLHADMVFYVHTGSGKLTWAYDDETGTIPLREGDVCNLNEGSVFYIQSDLEAERRKLRIYAMLTNTEDNTYNPSIGAYSRIDQLVKGFDKRIMQAALKVPDDLIEEIINKKNTPAVVHADSKKTNIVKTLEASFLKNFVGVGSSSNALEKYNIFDHEPDFKNRYGRSVAVSKTQLKSLKRTNIGFLMVHLNEGSIMGPHWNPKAAELAVAVAGKGMVRVVNGSSNEGDTERQSMRFKVNAGDAFVVPRFHSMAQMAFNDEPFVFLGFSTSAKDNHPQFFTGKGSVLHNLDKHILATSLGVSDRTVDELRRSPRDSIIFECSSCAEEEESAMKEEERERKEEETEREIEEEEERKREEEGERKREEEEDRKRERKREREEQEAKIQQEEREKKREEEEEKEQEEGGRERKREREEERVREEEEAKRQQEKREKKREKEKGEEAEAKKEQEKREMRRQEEAEKEQEQDKRGGEAEAEAAAQKEQEQARREQEKREKKRQEEEQSEGKEEDPTWWERPRREKGKGSEEEKVAEQEQEQAKRQQEEREKRREHESDPDHFEGRRALKVRNL